MVFKTKKPKAIDTKDLKSLGNSTVDLAKFVEDEFAEVASSMAGLQPEQVLHRAPQRPRAGLIVYADGTNFNPGSGEGPYYWGSDGAWHFMKTPVVPTLPVIAYLRVHLNTGQSISSGVITRVNFDTLDFDNKSWWDATNKRYVPQVAGKFLVTVNLDASPSGGNLTGLSGYIRKNGSTIVQTVNNVSSTNASCVASDILDMNGTTDNFDAAINVSFPSTCTIGAAGGPPFFTWMTAHYLGA